MSKPSLIGIVGASKSELKMILFYYMTKQAIPMDNPRLVQLTNYYFKTQPIILQKYIKVTLTESGIDPTIETIGVTPYGASLFMSLMGETNMAFAIRKFQAEIASEV